MGQTMRFQETLRGLAMIDECFVTGEEGLDLGLAGISALDPKIAALLQVAAPRGWRLAGGVPGVERWPGIGGGRK